MGGAGGSPRSRYASRFDYSSCASEVSRALPAQTGNSRGPVSPPRRRCRAASGHARTAAPLAATAAAHAAATRAAAPPACRRPPPPRAAARADPPPPCPRHFAVVAGARPPRCEAVVAARARDSVRGVGDAHLPLDHLGFWTADASFACPPPTVRAAEGGAAVAYCVATLVWPANMSRPERLLLPASTLERGLRRRGGGGGGGGGDDDQTAPLRLAFELDATACARGRAKPWARPCAAAARDARPPRALGPRCESSAGTARSAPRAGASASVAAPPLLLLFADVGYARVLIESVKYHLATLETVAELSGTRALLVAAMMRPPRAAGPRRRGRRGDLPPARRGVAAARAAALDRGPRRRARRAVVPRRVAAAGVARAVNDVKVAGPSPRPSRARDTAAASGMKLRPLVSPPPRPPPKTRCARSCSRPRPASTRSCST